MTRALVTGAGGFTGRHLVAHLATLGWQVTSVGRDQASDRAALRARLEEARPDVVFHLAALLKAKDPTHLYQVNVVGTVALLEALVETSQRPTLLLTSSSAVYGRTAAGVPVRESMRPRPITQYGASKLAQELVAGRYARAHGIPVVRARAFNLLGPGMSEELACGRFVALIADAERQEAPPLIETGSLDGARDFSDVRDVVRAYALLATSGQPGRVYNVCAGRAVSLRTCLDLLLGMARRPLTAALAPGLLQKDDLPAQVGDPRRLAALTGWRPEIPLEQSLADMLAQRRET